MIAIFTALGISLPVRAESPTQSDRRGDAQDDVGLFRLDGAAAVAIAKLELALYRELVARHLTQSEIASLSELRLTMGCKQLETACLGRGGRALGLGRMVVGEMRGSGDALELYLQLIAVGAGKTRPAVAFESTVALSPEDLDASNIDVTAARLLDGLFPGTAVVAAPVVPAPLEVAEPLGTHPPDSPSKPRALAKAPRWQRIGLGVSASLAGVFLITAIATSVDLRTRRREDLLDAVDESLEDDSDANDISRDTDDLCAAARASPMGDGKVRNANVTRVCNTADGLYKVVIGSAITVGVTGAAALVFGAFMIATKLRTPANVTWSPGVGPRSTWGASVSGRF